MDKSKKKQQQKGTSLVHHIPNQCLLVSLFVVLDYFNDMARADDLSGA